MSLTICIAQHNFVVGDVWGNAQHIVDAAHHAHQQGAQLLLTPELALSGYAAEDLYLRPAFIQLCDDALNQVARQTAGLTGLTLVVGHPIAKAPGSALTANGSEARRVAAASVCNAASVVRHGAIEHTYCKRELPNYQVFDERRYFEPGQSPCVFEVLDAQQQPVTIGLLICEDAWFEAPARDCLALGAQMLVVINASPFHIGKGNERERAMAQRVHDCGVPLVYAHLVGGQDEIVFEGRSFALNVPPAWTPASSVAIESPTAAPTPSVGARAPSFDALTWSLVAQRGPDGWVVHGSVASEASPEADLWHALVMGVRDYIGKNGFPGALLGLSGGVDSALVLAIAVDALGASRVQTVMMPSPYTADISWIDARDMADRLGVQYDEVSIVPPFEAFLGALAPFFVDHQPNTTEENLQARIRGTLLMALSNKLGGIVLTTGNKSEMATGYCTLYGDMAGGFAVIKDVSKSWVFRLAHWRNAHDPYGTGASPIPERILTRPPSAELRPDQKDEDSLPPYEVLDDIISRYMENNQGIESMVAAGLPQAAVEQVVRLIRINEYKRRQAPVGIRVTHRSFGKDWRYPNTNRFLG